MNYLIPLDLPCVQLEWDMKLWWPHNQAMIAFLKAFQATRNMEFWETFKSVTDYSFLHVRKYRIDFYTERFSNVIINYEEENMTPVIYTVDIKF